ncbi:hypothetical protein, partial [Salmonella enterica]|uniref:hypothetical protein n=1 Tax=Salmonella enterica TaxID=28901 RepID=UPI001F3850C8
EGVDLARIARLGQRTIGDVVRLDRVALLAGQGLVRRDGDRLALTAAGIPVLDAVLREVAV